MIDRADEPEYVPVTWKIAALILWAFAWRNIAWSIPFGLIIGLIAGIISVLTDISGNLVYNVALQGTTVIGGIFMSIWVMKKILNKKFNGFKIILVPYYKL